MTTYRPVWRKPHRTAYTSTEGTSRMNTRPPRTAALASQSDVSRCAGTTMRTRQDRQGHTLTKEGLQP